LVQMITMLCLTKYSIYLGESKIKRMILKVQKIVKCLRFKCSSQDLGSNVLELLLNGYMIVKDLEFWCEP
jgi:hypothetical protein